uniref:RNA polymerase II elongation factor ELL N-terminal domain-containing protein n=1 Tax=Timema poppense TaxID=170557 RepID=A0A7R9DLN7_TIMPO|nr:unnamed protein product [Timema poppensis]
MAALVEGIQYALSSQGNCDDNRALVFVKLTDSAHRAIEDLLKNKSLSSLATTQTPTKRPLSYKSLVLGTVECRYTRSFQELSRLPAPLDVHK